MTPVQRWTLAVVAPNLMFLELPVDMFRPPSFRRVPTITSMLTRDWGIRDCQRLLGVMEHLRRKGHRAHCAAVTGRREEEFLAWDLMRSILLAWAAVNLEWISSDQFSSFVIADGLELQRTFSNWASATESYEAGLAIWAAEGKVKKIAERAHMAFQTLLHKPESPWGLVDWRTPLTGTIAR